MAGIGSSDVIIQREKTLRKSLLMQGFCPKCGGGVCGVRERERVRDLVCLHLELKLKLHGTFFYLISSKFSVLVYSVKLSSRGGLDR